MSQNILLHSCCAPCAIWPQNSLKSKGFGVTGFFYNPNIHPKEEYERRKAAVEKFSQIGNLKMIYPEYDPQEYYQAIGNQKEKKQRCFACWSLRLGKTALFAKENGFTHFTTTLLVSPYQNQNRLRRIGEDISADSGVSFYYEDFRPGYTISHEQAKVHGLYCQRYCGCKFSLAEREIKKRKP